MEICNSSIHYPFFILSSQILFIRGQKCEIVNMVSKISARYSMSNGWGGGPKMYFVIVGGHILPLLRIVTCYAFITSY